MVKVYFRNIAIIIMALVSMVSLSYIILSDFINDSADIDDVFSTVTIWSLISLFCPVFILISKIAAIINPNTRIMMPKTDNLTSQVFIFVILFMLSLPCLYVITVPFFWINYDIHRLGSNISVFIYNSIASIIEICIVLSIMYFPSQAAYRALMLKKEQLH